MRVVPRRRNAGVLQRSAAERTSSDDNAGSARSWVLQSDAGGGLQGVRAVGLSAGASAPEVLVTGVLDAFRERYDIDIRRVVTAEESVSFKMPRVLREPA